MSEPWNPGEVLREYQDALAVVGELMPTTDEVIERFSAATFVAGLEGDLDRRERLVEEVKASAETGRMIAQLLEAFATGVQLRSVPLCREAANGLRDLAARDHGFAPTSEMWGR